MGLARSTKWITPRNISLTIFIISSFVFLGIYFPLTFISCSNETISVDYYVPGVSCFCKNSLGGSILTMTAIAKDTDFFRQFTTLTSSLEMRSFNSEDPFYRIYAYGLISYMNEMAIVEFTNNLVHNKSIDLFETDNPLNISLSSSIYANTQAYGGCVIYYGPSSYLIHNNTLDCVNSINYYNLTSGNFDSKIQLGYDKNPTYRRLCDLTFCQIKTCTSDRTWSIIIYSLGILSFIFTASRIIQFILSKYVFHRVENAITSDFELKTSL